MSVTQAQREWCRKQAQLIYENHLKHDPNFDSNGYHVAKDIPYVESLYRGLMTECAFSNEFGCPVSTELNHYGDGGVDFWLNLRCGAGAHQFAVDVKTKSVRKCWEGLRKSGTHLRVQRRECRPMTIYIFGIYLELADDAEVLAWQWGSVLQNDGELQRFKNSTGDQNWAHVMLFEELRSLDELKAKCIEQEQELCPIETW